MGALASKPCYFKRWSISLGVASFPVPGNEASLGDVGTKVGKSEGKQV